MLNLEQYKFHGTNNVHLSSLFVAILNKLGIYRNGFSINSIFKTYQIVDGEVIVPEEPLPNINIKTLIELIFSERPDIKEECWWSDLKIGDKVIIDFSDLVGCPLVISNDMAKMEGQEVEIQNIRPKIVSYSTTSKKTLGFNDDYAVYIIKECKTGIFHSKMFRRPNSIPIKKLEMSSLKIELFDNYKEEEDSLKDVGIKFVKLDVEQPRFILNDEDLMF